MSSLGIPYTLIFVLVASIFVALGIVPLGAVLFTKKTPNRLGKDTRGLHRPRDACGTGEICARYSKHRRYQKHFHLVSRWSPNTFFHIAFFRSRADGVFPARRRGFRVHQY